MPVREATSTDVPIVRSLQSLLPEPVDDLFVDGLPGGVTLVAVPDAAVPDAAVPDAAVPDAATGFQFAADGAVPVGYVHAYETGYVAELAVAPTYRGRGHGRALLARCLAELRERGCERAELEVAAVNDRARSLYESLGFAVVSRRADRYETGDGLVMRVDLDERSRKP